MKKILFIIFGILLIVCGVFMIFNPLAAFSTLAYLMGFGILLSGVADIVLWYHLRKFKKATSHLVMGIISVIFAIVIFSDVYFKLAFETVLVYIVAAFFLITGIYRIYLSIKIKPFDKNWWVFLIFGILLIICAIMSFCNPLILALALGLNFGINMMITGMNVISLTTLLTE